MRKERSIVKVLKSDGAEMSVESVVLTSYQNSLHFSVKGISMTKVVEFFDGAENLKVFKNDSDASVYSVYDGFGEVASVTQHRGGNIHVMLKKSLE